jgi:hypothetical protein
MNKKGENTIGVTIAIILGIAVLVFLIWGFSTNWSMFSSTAGAYSGTTNIDTVKQACGLQCQNGQDSEFCNAQKTVIDASGDSSQKKCTDAPLSAGTCDATGQITACT